MPVSRRGASAARKGLRTQLGACMAAQVLPKQPGALKKAARGSSLDLDSIVSSEFEEVRYYWALQSTFPADAFSGLLCAKCHKHHDRRGWTFPSSFDSPEHEVR